MSRPEDFLLGELSPEDAAAFQRDLASDPDLRAEVERLRPVVARLEAVPAEAWEGVEPPPLKIEPRTPAKRPRRLVLRPLVAVACAVALVAAGAGIGFVLDREPSPSDQLALKPVGALDPAASGRVSLVGDGASVRVSGLAPTADGDFYELWLLGKDKRLVGLGAFRVGADGTARLKVPLPVDPKTFTYFDLSLEPGDGDPGHSGVSVLRGPTVS